MTEVVLDPWGLTAVPSAPVRTAGLAPSPSFPFPAVEDDLDAFVAHDMAHQTLPEIGLVSCHDDQE